MPEHVPKLPKDPIEREARLVVMQRENNPNNEPTGHYTGRCKRCGSRDLWDDATAYGCNCCDAIYGSGWTL